MKPIYIVYTRRQFEPDKVQAFTERDAKKALSAFRNEMKQSGTVGYITKSHIQEVFR